MKVGIRKPSIKRSIKARTTGRVKRAIKKSVNPLYGKKGVGLITNPKKAVYNAVYHRTTISAKDVIKHASSVPDTVQSDIQADNTVQADNTYIASVNQANRIYASTFTLVLAIILLVLCLIMCIINPVVGILGMLFAGWFIYKHRKCKKALSDINIKE